MPASSSFRAARYAQIKTQFPQELRLLLDRLLGKELRERTLIYPAYSEANGSYGVATLVPPEATEGDEKGQHMVCIANLSRSGMKSHDGFFGDEQKCNDWMEASVQNGAFKRLEATRSERVQENIRVLLDGTYSASAILER